MNQRPPIQKPPQRQEQGSANRPQTGQQRQAARQGYNRHTQNRGISTAMITILCVTVALLVISIIILCVALAMNGNKPSEPSSNPADNVENNSSPQNTPSNGNTNKGGVATKPSRSSYVIGQAASYETLSGIRSNHAILVDLDNFQAVAGLNPDIRICPASMTKVMTVLIACENLQSLGDKLTVSQASVTYQTQHEASGYGLESGDTLTVEELLYLIYYRSDTVACLTIAEYISGSESEFVKLMNAKAQSMGLTNTMFSNSTGLYFTGNEYYTTCREMAAIMAYALENSLAKQILTSTGTYYLSSGSYKGNPIAPGWRVDENRLGSEDLGVVTVKGGKTGYETVDGSCLVTYAADKNGKNYIQVIVGGQDVGTKDCTADVKAIYSNYVK